MVRGRPPPPLTLSPPPPPPLPPLLVPQQLDCHPPAFTTGTMQGSQAADLAILISCIVAILAYQVFYFRVASFTILGRRYLNLYALNKESRAEWVLVMSADSKEGINAVQARLRLQSCQPCLHTVPPPRPASGNHSQFVCVPCRAFGTLCWPCQSWRHPQRRWLRR